MPTPVPQKKSQPKSQTKRDEKAGNGRNKDWDERLRTVGDARFTKVEWSGRDDPSWPLPKK